MERIPRSCADEYFQRLKPKAKPIYIRNSHLKGLVLSVMPTGLKSWIFEKTLKDSKKSYTNYMESQARQIIHNLDLMLRF